jgi:hypothetical protein
MKENTKKLAVLVITTAIAMFIAVPMASADDHQKRKSIQGEYYFTGSGPCLMAPTGFNPALQPNNVTDLGPWNASNSTWEGIISFKRNGTGEFKSIFRVVERPSSLWPPPTFPSGNDIPDVGAANISWKFNYDVSHSGRITFTYETDTYLADFKYGPQQNTQVFLDVTGPWYGVLSPEGNNIIFTWGVPLQLIATADQANKIPLFPMICNVVLQGFRCDGQCPELVYSPPPGP